MRRVSEFIRRLVVGGSDSENRLAEAREELELKTVEVRAKRDYVDKLIEQDRIATRAMGRRR